jgi:hypothetical protein
LEIRVLDRHGKEVREIAREALRYRDPIGRQRRPAGAPPRKLIATHATRTALQRAAGRLIGLSGMAAEH